MAKLARKTMKVFAQDAQVGVFGSLRAGNPTLTTDPDVVQSLPAYEAGWNNATYSAERLPAQEERNGLDFLTTYQLTYWFQNGFAEWHPQQEYVKGGICKEITTNGFRLYQSLQDNNTNHLLSDTSWWSVWYDSENPYAFSGEVVHNTGDESVAGVKTFSSSPLVPTPAASDNSTKAATTAFVNNKFQVVQSLPASPDANTYYFVVG